MAPGGSLSDTLRKLLDDTGETPKDERVPHEGAPVAATDSVAPMPAEPAKLPRPAPRKVDVAARLADPIKEIEFTETPLQDFLQFVTTYSTIPVTLDPDVLVWLKLTPNTPVNLRMSDTTVAKLLDGALAKAGLVAVPLDNHVLVTRKAIGDGAIRKTRRQVADLIGGNDNGAELLVPHIVSLIAPQTWADVGGEGTARVEDGRLVLEQSDPVLLEISSFLERLRVARGLPKQSAFDEKLFQPVSRTTRAAPLLAKPVTLNFSRPTSFPRIVRRLAQDSGMSILIDWQAIAQAGWNPDAEVTMTVTSQPLSDALLALLQPMDLAFRIVDATTVQITTPAELAARTEVEIYRVESLLGESRDEAQLLQQIHNAVPPDWFTDSTGNGALRFDPAGRCLIVLLSQPRQQAFEKTLHTLAK
jgi:hypothetical protein